MYGYTTKRRLLNLMERTIKAADSCIEGERGGINGADPLFTAWYRFSYMLHQYRGLSALLMQPAGLLFIWAVQSLCIILYDRLL